MRRTILLFSLLILSIIVLFQVSKYTLYQNGSVSQILLALIAIVLFFCGALIYRKFMGHQVPDGKIIVDHLKIRALNLSNREYEVLLALNDHLSNKEISDKLYITESTTKKHLSKIFNKLGVHRRQDALKKARELSLLP